MKLLNILLCFLLITAPVSAQITSNASVNPWTGELDLTGDGAGASSLSDLSDIGTSTATSGNVLVADGTNFDARALTVSDFAAPGNDTEVIYNNSGTLAGDTGMLFDDSNNILYLYDSTVAKYFAMYHDGTDGIISASSGLLTMYGALGNWLGIEDSVKSYFGAAKDGYIEFDGDSLNIKGDAVGATDDIEIIADNIYLKSANLTIGETASDYALPTEDGNANEVLATNGSGAVSFTDVTGIISDAVSLSDLSDIGTSTATAGNILYADGSSFNAVSLSSTVDPSGASLVGVYDEESYYGSNNLEEILSQLGAALGVTGTWKEPPVLSVTQLTPPVAPDTGDRYIVPDAAGGDWYSVSGTWDYRQPIAIESELIPSDQTDFPILLRINDQSNHIFGEAQSDGDDILFTSSDKVTKLDHEIEIYEDGDGEEYLEIYIEHTIDGDADDTIYMYYGNDSASDQSNATGTWNANFDIVYHMTDKTTSTIDDSTDNHDIDKYAANEPQEVGVYIGKSQFGDGVDDYMDTNSGYDYSGNGAFSVFMWISGVRNGSNYLFCQSHLPSYSSDWILGYNNNGLWFRSQQVNGGNVIADGSLHQIGFTFDGTDAQLYIDGEAYGSPVTPTGYGADGSSVKILARGDANSVYSGVVDEAFITTNELSADWIETMYNNRAAPDIFASPQSPESNEGANDWTGYGNYITEWNGAAWTFEGPPDTGWSIYVEDEAKIFVFDGDKWVSTDYAINHEQLSGLLGGAANDHWHMTGTEHTSATREANDVQDGLMPAGRLSYWNDKWTPGDAVEQELEIEYDTPSIRFRDTDDDSAYKLIHDAGDGTYPYLALYRGTADEGEWAASPAAPLMYWDGSNNLILRTTSDNDNFLTFSTLSNEPVITATGALNIISSTGAIGFDDDTITTSGTASVGVLSVEGGTYDTNFAAGTPTETVTYQLPLADGSNGQQLTTNGSATLSWATGGEANQNAFTTFATDDGTISADSAETTGILNGANGITVSGDTLTLTYTFDGALSNLSDIGTSTATSGNVLIADGTNFDARALADGDIPNDITIDSASDVSCSECLIIGTEVKAGTLTNSKYCTWDSSNSQVVCNSDGGEGGGSVAYDDITAPDANTNIGFTTYTNTWESTATSGDFFTINATTADTALRVKGTTYSDNYKGIPQVVTYQDVTNTYDIVENVGDWVNATHVIAEQPDTPREVACTVVCVGMGGEVASGTITVTGTDAGGNTVQDALSVNVTQAENSETYTTDYAYRKITSIVTTNQSDDCVATQLTSCVPTTDALGIPMYPLDATTDVFAVTENGADNSAYTVSTTYGKITGITISDNDDYEIYYRRGR